MRKSDRVQQLSVRKRVATWLETQIFPYVEHYCKCVMGVVGKVHCADVIVSQVVKTRGHFDLLWWATLEKWIFTTLLLLIKHQTWQSKTEAHTAAWWQRTATGSLNCRWNISIIISCSRKRQSSTSMQGSFTLRKCFILVSINTRGQFNSMLSYQ